MQWQWILHEDTIAWQMNSLITYTAVVTKGRECNLTRKCPSSFIRILYEIPHPFSPKVSVEEFNLSITRFMKHFTTSFMIRFMTLRERFDADRDLRHIHSCHCTRPHFDEILFLRISFCKTQERERDLLLRNFEFHENRELKTVVASVLNNLLDILQSITIERWLRRQW